jgi:signal transduction histidine kinase
MTIRNKLTLRFFFLVLAIISAGSVTIAVFSEMHRKEDFYIRMRNKAAGTARLLVAVDEENVELLRKIEKDNPMSLPEEGLVIWNKKNHILFDSDKKGIIKGDSAVLNQIRKSGELQWETGNYEVLGFMFSDKNDAFVVIVAAQDIYGKRRIIDLKWIMVTVFSLSIGFIILAGWIYAGRALLPISKIIARVKQITISSLNLRLEEGDNVDELSKLSGTFNLMLERLESGVKIQKDFIANASHEMRTPLTSMTGQIEVALLNERSADHYKKVLTSILDDIKNLNRTSNRLLLLAQANTEKLQIEMDEIRIDDLVWQCREELIKLQPDFSISIELEIENEEGLEISGNAQLLKTTITNLLENGCKYSEMKHVTVQILAGKEGSTLNFIDQGIGIPSQDLAQIFQPFYRASNSTSSRGHGIGLSLVHKITEIHKGRISVNSVHGEGTTFSLFLSARKNKS